MPIKFAAIIFFMVYAILDGSLAVLIHMFDVKLGNTITVVPDLIAAYAATYIFVSKNNRSFSIKELWILSIISTILIVVYTALLFSIVLPDEVWSRMLENWNGILIMNGIFNILLTSIFYFVVGEAIARRFKNR